MQEIMLYLEWTGNFGNFRPSKVILEIDELTIEHVELAIPGQATLKTRQESAGDRHGGLWDPEIWLTLSFSTGVAAGVVAAWIANNIDEWKPPRFDVDGETVEARGSELAALIEALIEEKLGEARHEKRRNVSRELTKVLYLTSSGPEGNSLRVDAEVNRVLSALRGAVHRDELELHVRPAATPQDILDGLNDLKPRIVHFSGHGSSDTIVLDTAELDGPGEVPTTYATLVKLLSSCEPSPKVEPPRVSRRGKLSKDTHHDEENLHPDLPCRTT